MKDNMINIGKTLSTEKSASKLPRRLIPAKYMTLEQTKIELDKIRQQFIVIHNMPKIGDKNPLEYMHESLEGLRSRCIELHWRSCELMSKMYKR